MFLDIQELERHPLDFEEEFQPGVIDLGGEARQRTPLKTSGHAEIVEEHHGKHEIITDIRLRGRLSAGLELQCARCLEPVAQDVVREFELLYRPLGADAGRDELSVTDAEAEIGYYQGDGHSAGRCVARAGSAGAAVEGDLPRRLQGLVPALRQEFERRKVFLQRLPLKIRGGRRCARFADRVGTLRSSCQLSAVSFQQNDSCVLHSKLRFIATQSELTRSS